MSKTDEQATEQAQGAEQVDEQESAGTDVGYTAPAGAIYAQHHLNRYAQAGAEHEEVAQLASELDALPADEREARMTRLSQMSNTDLRGELQRRRRAAEEGRDPAEVAAELGSPLREALAGDGPDDNVSRPSAQTDGEGVTVAPNTGSGEEPDTAGEGAVDLDHTGNHTIEEITGEVGDDPDKARRAIASENERSRPRRSLLDDLEEIAGR